MAARQNGGRDLPDLLGREDELHVLRRLLERLQQPVEGGLRQHGHFVDYVDLVARRHRTVADALDDLADVADAGARRGVHLQHVDVAVLGDRQAVVAASARPHRRPAAAVGPGAVQPLGDTPRGGGLKSEERPAGNEWVRTCKSRWSPDMKKKKKKQKQ